MSLQFDSITDVHDMESAEENIHQTIEHFKTMNAEEIIQTLLHDFITFGKNILIAIIIFIIGRWIITRIVSLMKVILEKRNIEISLRNFILSVVKVTLLIFLILIIIGTVGIDTSSFIALFASAGVAVGMALSGALQNFAGGVMIIIFKPYKVGDFIEAQGQIGTVKEIQIVNTILNTPDNKVIIIPNGAISTGIINNYSQEKVRRIDWSYGIAYGDDFEYAKSVLLELIKEDNRIFSDPQPFIVLGELADSSVNITVRVWAKQCDYWNIFFEMNEKVYKRFGEKNINIPFPQMDVHFYKS